jgi:hypothetical protein
MKRNEIGNIISRISDDEEYRVEITDYDEKVEVVEEFLDIPDEKIQGEAGNNLIRFDMNMIEYPLFSKNKLRKINQVVKYYFNQKKESYIEVRPNVGNSIPGDFDEKVFIALIKIMRDRRYGNEFIVTNGEILNNLNITNIKTQKGMFKRLRESMLRLTSTIYNFKNTLYMNRDNRIVEDLISTNIMNIRVLSSKEAKGEEKHYFADNRVKEVYKISLSQPFYENILRKGYLVYNSELLLQIESPVSRSIYLLINKWRFDKLYLKEKIMNFIKRIPLKYNKATLSRTVKIIENACNHLVERGLIKEFKILKSGTWETAEIEFYFEEQHNSIKQENFYLDRNQFQSLLITHTQEENIEADGVYQNDTNHIPTVEMVEKILNVLPARAQELKTMPKTISDSIREYGFEKVIQVAKYMKSQKVGKVRSYFIKALENNWAQDYEDGNEKKSSLQTTNQEKNINYSLFDEKIVVSSVDNLNYEIYMQKMSLEEKKEFEEKVLQAYIEKCGTYGTIQKKIFEKTKESLKLEYFKIVGKKLYPHLFNSDIEKKVGSSVDNLICKTYEDISMFLFDVLEKFEELNIESGDKVLKIVSITKKFKGTLGGYELEITYSEDNRGSLIIKR